MAYCKKCGTQLDNDATFCANCGTTASAVQTVVYVKPKVPGRGFGISSMVLGIIGLVYSFFYAIGVASLVEAVEDSIFFSDASFEALLPSVVMLSALPIMSLCFAPAAFKRGYKNGVSSSGLIMGILGLIGYLYAALTIVSTM